MSLPKLPNIQAYALRLLARREHSRFELKRKLLSKGFSTDLIEATLDECNDKGWQDDRRFVEIYMQVRIERGDGPLKIQAKFRECGVSENIILEAFALEDIFWQEQLQRKWRKKCQADSKDLKKRAKQIRFLQSRGFTLEQIHRFMKNQCSL